MYPLDNTTQEITNSKLESTINPLDTISLVYSMNIDNTKIRVTLSIWCFMPDHLTLIWKWISFNLPMHPNTQHSFDKAVLGSRVWYPLLLHIQMKFPKNLLSSNEQYCLNIFLATWRINYKICLSCSRLVNILLKIKILVGSCISNSRAAR